MRRIQNWSKLRRLCLRLCKARPQPCPPKNMTKGRFGNVLWMHGIYLRPFLRGPPVFPAPPPRCSSMVGSWDGLRAVGHAALTVGTLAEIGIIGIACDSYHKPPQPRNCPPMVELRLIAVSSVKVTKTPPKQGYISTANATKLYFSVVRAYFAASLARGSSPPKEILISTGPVCLLS